MGDCTPHARCGPDRRKDAAEHPRDSPSKLREIIAGLAPDEEVVITDNRQLVAKLIGGRPAVQKRPGPGFCTGMSTIVAADDEHLGVLPPTVAAC